VFERQNTSDNQLAVPFRKWVCTASIPIGIQSTSRASAMETKSTSGRISKGFQKLFRRDRPKKDDGRVDSSSENARSSLQAAINSGPAKSITKPDQTNLSTRAAPERADVEVPESEESPPQDHGHDIDGAFAYC